jgi:hypothetical protein
MRLAARCSQKLLVSISYVPFRAAGYAKSDHPSPPGCLLLGTKRTSRDVRSLVAIGVKADMAVTSADFRV